MYPYFNRSYLNLFLSKHAEDCTDDLGLLCYQDNSAFANNPKYICTLMWQWYKEAVVTAANI